MKKTNKRKGLIAFAPYRNFIKKTGDYRVTIHKPATIDISVFEGTNEFFEIYYGFVV